MLKGSIVVHKDGTVSVEFENGAHAVNLFPQGLKRFVEAEIEQLKRKEVL